MRAAVLVLACASACAGTRPASTAVPDDLELDGALERRSAPAPIVEDAPPPAIDPAVRVEVVEPARTPDGPRIDLAVRDADVADVLRMIATVADVGLVVSDDVRAKVTLEVRRVTWRQAIDVIAHLEGLEVIEEDGILRVHRAAKAP